VAVPLIKAAEDSHFNFLTVSFARFYRWIGFLLAVFLPGFWMALLAYHQDQIPFPLLATVTVARSGLPFPAPLELIIVLFLFEMFREAGQRLPSPWSNPFSGRRTNHWGCCNPFGFYLPFCHCYYCFYLLLRDIP
jgi:hypothetical protein